MTTTKRASTSQPSEATTVPSPASQPSETAITQPPSTQPSETTITQLPSTLLSAVARSDALATVENWLSNLGIRIGEISDMKIDLSENDSAYTLLADIPGANKEDIKIQLEGNRITISVEKTKAIEPKEGERMISRERPQESISRIIRLDEEVDENKAQARYEHGVLELSLPKKHVKTVKHIEIK